MNNISWINDSLAVSGAFLDDDIPYLKREGVDAIVDLRREFCDNAERIRKCGMEFLHVAVDDCYCPSFDQLEEVLNFAGPILDDGKGLLVHCQNGCGRSPLVIVAILVDRGMNVSDAVSLVQDKHPRTGFTEHQERFIRIKLKDFFSSRRNKR